MNNALVPTDCVPPTTCVECGTINDGAMTVGPVMHRPRAGDLSICVVCRHIAIFTEDLHLREPTIDEMLAISRQPLLRVLLEKMVQRKSQH